MFAFSFISFFQHNNDNLSELSERRRDFNKMDNGSICNIFLLKYLTYFLLNLFIQVLQILLELF